MKYYELLDPKVGDRPRDTDEVCDADGDRSDKENWIAIGELRALGASFDRFIELWHFIYRRPLFRR